MEIKEGTKVKLKVDQIMGYQMKHSNPFKEWAIAHKDQIWTVFYEKEVHKEMGLCCLKEDNYPIKWLLNIKDLEVIGHG